MRVGFTVHLVFLIQTTRIACFQRRVRADAAYRLALEESQDILELSSSVGGSSQHASAVASGSVPCIPHALIVGIL